MDFSGLSQSQMEVILGPDSMQLETLISQLLSSSEEKRIEADSSINSLGLKLADLLASSNSHNIDFRKKFAVVLGKLFTDERIWGNLSVLTQSSLKSILLNCVRLEESEPIMTTLCRTVSELANSRHKWPELLPFLNECVSSNSTKLIESFFLIYGWCEGYVCRPLSPGIIISHSVFVNTLNVTLSLGVRIAILASAYRFTYYLPTSNERLPFQNLLPAMLTTLTDALSNGEEDFAREVLRIFTAWAELNPKFFRMQLAIVVGSIIDIAEDKSLKDLTRNSAIKFLLALVQAREKAPGMMKRLPRFTYTCFAILLNMLLDIKDEPSWHSAETKHEKAGETNNYKFGKLYLSRFSDALGGKTVAPIAIEQLSAYLVAPEWEKRYAALVALAQIAKGSSKVMIKHLEQLVSMALHSFQDPHPRVRWAAIRSIGWLSIDFCPDLQDHCHNLVLPALSAAMDDFQNPRVQAQAALAVNNFCYSEKPETLVPYLDGILSKLLVLLQNDIHLVKAAALKALGAVAELSMENFREYYDLVMPYLKTMLVNANDKSNRLLRVRALECISFVAMVVGKERFRDDLKQVMEVLISLQKSLVEEFGTTVYILKASCKICKCMGKEFLPYMSTVMLPLVKCAQVELDETVSFDDSIHKVKFGYEIICASGKDLLLAKRSACHSHGLFAEILKEDYYPWISQAASILVPLLKFYSYVDVRISAINAMSRLLGSAKLAVEKGIAQRGNQQYLKSLSDYIILALRDALHSEPDKEVCTILLGELDKCLKICGPLLNEDQVCSIINEIKHVITESSHRKGALTERTKSEDFDDEEAELMSTERLLEVVVFSNAGDVLITLIKTFKAAFLPSLNELSSYIMPMMGKDASGGERHKCISIFNTLLENCGKDTLQYYNMSLPYLLDSSNDEDPCVRENALYGLCLCLKYGGSVIKPFIGEALPKINVVTTYLHAREPLNVGGYSCAVYALGTICQLHWENVDLAQIIPVWLNCLPIKDNANNAQMAHDQLCSVVERSEREVLGANYLHFPKVISVFAEVLWSENNLIAQVTGKRMINLLRRFHQTLPPAVFASARSLLLPRQEMELESILSTEEDVYKYRKGHRLWQKIVVKPLKHRGLKKESVKSA